MRGSFFERHFGTLIIVLMAVLAQIATYSVLQSRVTVLEKEQGQSITATEHGDLTRRVTILESEVVPRSEHVLRDEQINIRLKSIEDQVHSMNQILMDMQAQQAQQHRRTQ